MAQIAVQPIILNDVLLSLTLDAATHSFEKHVSQVELVPSSSPVVWKGLNPTASFTFPQTATWVCNLSYAQDWETTNSLARFLHDNEGETVAATFEPKLGGATWTANLVLTPGAIGGTVDSVAVATVALGVNGKPVRGA